MKLLASILISLSVLLTAVTTIAQVNDKLLSKTIIVPGKEVRIDSLVNMLNNQTGIEFSFNSNKISPSKKIAVPRSYQTLSQWLITLKTKMGIDHKVIGSHIILVDKKQSPVVTKKTSRTVSPGQKPGTKNAKVSSAQSGKKHMASAVSTVKQPEKNVTGLPDSAAATDTITLHFTDTEGKDVTVTGLSVSAAGKPAITYISKITTKPRVMDMAKPVSSKVHKINDAVSGSFVSPLSKIDLGPQGVGVSFERRLGKKSIIDLSLGVGGGYAITGHQFKYKVDGLSGPEIYASVNPRLYYNSQNRLTKGKTIERNAGNYFGFRMKYVTDAVAENFVVWDAVLFNFHWGMQRPVGRRWIFNGHVGPGYGFAHSFIFGNRLTGLNHYYGSVELKLSYVFSRLNQ